jgi:hypothetical protein
MSATAFKRACAALLHDDAGEGLADYSVLLGIFAVQCVCGAIALNHHVDSVVRAIHAVFA